MKPLTIDVFCSAIRRVPMTTPHPVCFGPEMVPAPGDIVLGKITGIGHHDRLEISDGREVLLHPGIICALVLGRRYSTREFHGEIPGKLIPGDKFHLLNAGGTAGWVRDRNQLTHTPTTLEFLGYASSALGKKLSLTDYRLETKTDGTLPTVILVVGADMEVGKTTAAAFAIRALSAAGHKTAGVKLTGTARMKDLFMMENAGGDPTYDFVDFGLASTFGTSAKYLVQMFHTMRQACGQDRCEYMTVEVADGLFQPETHRILTNTEIMEHVSLIIFASADSVGAYGGTTVLKQLGHAPHFLGGLFTASRLKIDEVKTWCRLPILTIGSQDQAHFVDLARKVRNSENGIP